MSHFGGVKVFKINGFPWAARKHGKRYQNLYTNFVPGWRELMRWRFGLGPAEPTPVISDSVFRPQISEPDFALIHSPAPDAITVTWIGHSTFLLQTGGMNFLTDPIFSKHCSPIPLKRLARRTQPGLTLQQLPHIDAVLLSHSHYDHLDKATLRQINAPIFCPEGVGALLNRLNISQTHELTWGERAELANSVELFCLPAQHGSARTAFDRNHTLWCSWLLNHRNRKVFFTGDSGYAPFFAGFGEMFGPVDLALIPIAAYRPRWFMEALHMNPEEAIKVHRDIRAKSSIAMHWGTFELADDPIGEPPILLERAREMAGLAPEAFRLLQFGETAIF